MAASNAPGFLTQISPPVPYDDDLIDLLQPIVVGILDVVPPTFVRPRWQPGDTPNQPDYGVDWIALGISNTRHEAFAYEGHVAEGEGFDNVERTEELDVLISCYGPHAGGNAGTLRDGFSLGQNRTSLHDLGADLLFVGNPTTLPALVTGVWVRRVDLTITLRRYTTRQYGVKTIVEIPTPIINNGVPAFGIDNEQYITPIIVDKP